MLKIIINTIEIEFIIAKRYKNKKWLAAKVGVSKSYLSHWLLHRKNPNADNRRKLMNALKGKGVTWETLFIRKDP